MIHGQEGPISSGSPKLSPYLSEFHRHVFKQSPLGGWFRAAHTPAGTSFQVLQQSSWGMESKLSGLFGGSHELWGVAKKSRLSEVRGEDLTSSPGSRQPVYSSRNNSNRMCHNMQRARLLLYVPPAIVQGRGRVPQSRSACIQY